MKVSSLLASLVVCGLPVVFGACAAPGFDEDSEDDDLGMTQSEIAAPGGWALPASVAAAGDRQTVAYDDAPPWRGAAGCGGRFLAGTEEVSNFLREKFPQITSYGGYSCRQNTANSRQTSVHGTGRAVDIFIPLVGGQADNTKGDAVANWLVENAESIGVQYIIWDRSSWNASRAPGNKLRGYTGPHPHHDHLHVELSNEGAARQTAFFRAPPPATPAPPAPAPDTTPTVAGACTSSTLGRDVTEGVCVQRPKDKLWFRCVDGLWSAASATDEACTERHAL